MEIFQDSIAHSYKQMPFQKESKKYGLYQCGKFSNIIYTRETILGRVLTEEASGNTP